MAKKKENSTTPAPVPPVPPVPTPQPEPAPQNNEPKISCDVTIVVRDGQIKDLRVESTGEVTYSQLKEICSAGAQQCDLEFTRRCSKLGAHVYKPDLSS